MTSIGGGSQNLIGQMSRSFESIGLEQQQVKTVFDSFQGLGDNLVPFADKMVDHLNMGPEKAGADVLQDVRGGAATDREALKWKVSDAGYKEQGPLDYKEQSPVGYKEQSPAGHKETEAQFWPRAKVRPSWAQGEGLVKPVPASDFKSYEPLEAAGKKFVGMDGKGMTATAPGRAAPAAGGPLLDPAMFTPLASLAGAAISTPGRLAMQEPFPPGVSGAPRLPLERISDVLQTGGGALRTHLESIGGKQSDSALRSALEKFNRMSDLIHDMGRLLSDMNRNLLR